jgi:hypothetical protein
VLGSEVLPTPAGQTPRQLHGAAPAKGEGLDARASGLAARNQVSTTLDDARALLVLPDAGSGFPLHPKSWYAVTIKPLFAWYDLWVGAFWDAPTRRLYILPVPCIGVVLQFSATKEGTDAS